MSVIDLDVFRATSLQRDPYDHLIVPGFVRPEAIAAVDADYPRIGKPGSFPLDGLAAGPAFTGLMDELRGPAVRDAFADKFGIALDGRPVTITVRGRCQEKDGRIHTDTESKIITVLIYMNTEWGVSGGRLRVLRSADDLEDYAAEVPPHAGTLLAFRRGDRSWHGHQTYVGERRVIQLNWVTDEAVVRRERRRHRVSAWMKSLIGQGEGKRAAWR
jgi:hypothetical protein